MKSPWSQRLRTNECLINRHSSTLIVSLHTQSVLNCKKGSEKVVLELTYVTHPTVKQGELNCVALNSSTIEKPTNSLLS